MILQQSIMRKLQQIDLKGGKNSNFFFIEGKEGIENVIIDLCSKRLPNHYRVDPFKDIQVLTPMQRSSTGAANLNALLQEKLNKSDLFIKRGATEFRYRDKVMQIRNNYDKLVFNGDIGYICHVDMEDKKIRVMYDDREVEYEALELDELVLAYATTIHKAQGSEYPIVVMPISFSHYMMLQRNLIYTGITRAKDVAVIVGERKAIYTAINNADVRKRNTKLASRLLLVTN